VADSLKADKGSFFNRYCLSCTLVLLLIPKLKFQLQASKFFGSRSRTIWSIKHKKTLHYLCNSLSPRTISVEPEPKFQAPAPPSKSFWLRFQASKIAWAPAAQSLVSCVHHFSSVFSWLILNCVLLPIGKVLLHWVQGCQIYWLSQLLTFNAAAWSIHLCFCIFYYRWWSLLLVAFIRRKKEHFKR